MFLYQAATAYSKSLTSGTKQLGGGGSGEGEITLRWGTQLAAQRTAAPDNKNIVNVHTD